MSNLSKIKREKMISYLEDLKKLHNDDNSIKLFNEIEDSLTSKKYGLVFEKHIEKVDEEIKKRIPVFCESKNNLIKADSSLNYNFLLEGDNLCSLYLLEKTHKNSIDVIYIDPPYNTGHEDFVYNDSFVGVDDAFIHSKWLSFMEERLTIARQLLKRDGVIFISIDNHEVFQLKLLCDSIFGSKNFLGCLIQNKINSQNDAINFQENHEYILCYVRNRVYTNVGGRRKELAVVSEKVLEKTEVFKENDRFYYIGREIHKSGSNSLLTDRKNLGYTIYYNEKTKDIIARMNYDPNKVTESSTESIYKDDKELIKKGYMPVRPPKRNGKLGCWTWDVNKVNDEKDILIAVKNREGEYFFKKKNIVDKKLVKKEKNKYFVNVEKEMNVRSILDFSTSEGTAALKEIFKDKVFNNPKNVNLMKFLIRIFKKKDPIILDFFAGSGTTGQAVMELNEEDGGNRKFILCTNNENNICEKVTYKRICSVIKGYSKHNGIKANLKYFKVGWIDRKPQEYLLSNALCLHIKEMIELQNFCEVDNKKNILILNKDDYNKYIKNNKNVKEIEKLWINQNIVFDSSELNRLRAFKFEYIPKQFFATELKEVGE